MRQFRQAAREFEVPSQNLLYADVDGNIGYQSPGTIPIRTGYDGKYPVLGWSSKYDWIGYIPFDALPSIFNPRENFIVTANNAVIFDQTYPYFLTDDWAYGSRSQRIRDLITDAVQNGKKITANAIAALRKAKIETIAVADEALEGAFAADQFDEGAVECDAGFGIEHAGVAFADEVCGDDFVFGVGHDAFESAL